MATVKNKKFRIGSVPVWEIVYWLTASLLMFYVFSNRHYDIHIRACLSALLLATSFINAQVANRILIPKVLFKGKRWLFLYLLFALFFVSLWLISIAVFSIVWYSSRSLPSIIIPTIEDVIILLTGTYLISLLSSVFYFTKESYQSKEEKINIERQKNSLELKLKEAQLQLLKEQIHPHFIFNMMNNLYALVNENTALSREVIMRLSDLLDYMLYECSADSVDLSNEIKFINNYIELERIRHDESFNVETDFPKNTSGIQIAPLILFPFIENAFKHGLKQTGNDFISMKIKITELQIQFYIQNNLPNSLAANAKPNNNNGLGLKNVRERLELLYQNKHELQISTHNNIFDAKLNITR